MLERFRKRVTYTNIAVTFALVFAMSGGAYAAGKVIIKSRSQISSKVLKELKGNAGPVGPAGAKGDNGAPGVEGKQGLQGVEGKQGSLGPEGKAGPTGSTGPAGPKGSTGPAGPTGPEGVCSTANCTLPAGVTETGTWGVAAPPGKYVVGGVIHFAFAFAPISFAIPLKAGLEADKVHVIAGGGNGDGTTCPATSSVDKPGAMPGNLCIFESEGEINVESVTPKSLETGEEGEAGKTGAVLLVRPTSESESVLASGTWATAG